MSAAENKAVFLSYASQDAEAVERIAEALRAAGVEVWFDRAELVGGDAWDQKIRKQIKECALFMPVISASTNARAEGYFRLEWKLAVDRSHLMADDQPFLLPVVIDDTSDAAARVPDRFREVQWTRLTVKDTPETLAARVGKLLVGGSGTPVGRVPAGGAKAGGAKSRGNSWITHVAIIGGILTGLVYALRPVWQPAAPRKEKPAATAAVPAPAVSEGVKLAQRARALYDKVGFGRDDLALADDFAKRATDAEPTVALCWGVRAHVQAAYLFRGFAVGDEFVQRARDAQSFANRALALEADEVEALLALGRVANYRNASAQAEEIFGRALAAHPNDNRIRRALGTLLRYQPRRLAEALTVLQDAVRRNPRDALAHYDLALAWANARDFPSSAEACEAALAVEPFGSAFLHKAVLAYSWKGDVAAMRAALDQLAPRDRTEDRAVFLAMRCGVLERSVDRTEAAAALTSRDYLEDNSFEGPKAWFPALAYQRAGQGNQARAQWQAAEAVLRERRQADPKAESYRVQLALTLAWLDRAEEAAREIAPLEAAWREQMNPFRALDLGQYYAALGDAARAVPYLRLAIHKVMNFTHVALRLDPFLDKVRDTPEFAALLANLPDQPAPVVPVPYRGKAPAAATAASREAEQLIGGIHAMLARVNYTRENLALAEEQARKATELAPEMARAWAARATVQAAYVQRTWDPSDQRRQSTQTFAVRALSLDPDDAEAMSAQAAVTSPVQGEALLRRALELRPAEPAVRRLLARALRGQGRFADSQDILREAVRLFPDDAMTHYDLGATYLFFERDAERALASINAALALESFASAIVNKVMALACLKGDLAAAQRTLDLLSPTDRSEDRPVSFAMWLGLLSGDSGRVKAAAALTERPYFEDFYLPGPKAWMLALALHREGKDTLARLQWEAAETVLRARLQANPGDLRERFRLYVTLAWLGRTHEITAEVATFEGVVRESDDPGMLEEAARFYAGLGNAAKAVPFLRKILSGSIPLTDRTLPLDPWWDKLRGQVEFEALLAEAKARVERK